MPGGAVEGVADAEREGQQSTIPLTRHGHDSQRPDITAMLAWVTSGVRRFGKRISDQHGVRREQQDRQELKPGRDAELGTARCRAGDDRSWATAASACRCGDDAAGEVAAVVGLRSSERSICGVQVVVVLLARRSRRGAAPGARRAPRRSVAQLARQPLVAELAVRCTPSPALAGQVDDRRRAVGLRPAVARRGRRPRAR